MLTHLVFTLGCDRLCCTMNMNVRLRHVKQWLLLEMPLLEKCTLRLILGWKKSAIWEKVQKHKIASCTGDPEWLCLLFKMLSGCLRGALNFFAITLGVAQSAEGKKADYLFTIVENADSEQRTREVEQRMRDIQHLWALIVLQQLERDRHSFVLPGMLNGAGKWCNFMTELQQISYIMMYYFSFMCELVSVWCFQKS